MAEGRARSSLTARNRYHPLLHEAEIPYCTEQRSYYTEQLSSLTARSRYHPLLHRAEIIPHCTEQISSLTARSRDQPSLHGAEIIPYCSEQISTLTARSRYHPLLHRAEIIPHCTEQRSSLTARSRDHPLLLGANIIPYCTEQRPGEGDTCKTDHEIVSFFFNIKLLYRVRNSTPVNPIPSQKNPLHNIARRCMLILSSHPCCKSLITAIPSSHSRSLDYNLVAVPGHATKV